MTCCAPAGGWTRRQFVVAGAALATGGPSLLGSAAHAEEPPWLGILPRRAWAGDVEPGGAIATEPDVRFLVVHHTVNANDYAPDDVVGLLQAMHSFHTGAQKRWPDIAYNFVVDRFGRIWETRAGSVASLDGAPAVAGDATGGNQGFDQKCAFLGDHRAEPPSPAAESAMIGLLARIAERHAIDPTPGATTSFASRGSNLHPAGDTVTTPTITGHRTLSSTACPGDAAMARVAGPIPTAVATLVKASGPVTTTPATAGPTTTSATSATPEPGVAAAPAKPAPASDPVPLPLAATAAGAVAIVGGALLRLRTR